VAPCTVTSLSSRTSRCTKQDPSKTGHDQDHCTGAAVMTRDSDNDTSGAIVWWVSTGHSRKPGDCGSNAARPKQDPTWSRPWRKSSSLDREHDWQRHVRCYSPGACTATPFCVYNEIRAGQDASGLSAKTVKRSHILQTLNQKQPLFLSRESLYHLVRT